MTLSSTRRCTPSDSHQPKAVGPIHLACTETCREANSSVADDIWDKRLFIRTGPGCPAILHIRKSQSPWGRYTIQFRDWLRDHPAERMRYQQMKTELALAHAGDADFDDYARAKTGYFDTVQTTFEQYGAPGTAG